MDEELKQLQELVVGKKIVKVEENCGWVLIFEDGLKVRFYAAYEDAFFNVE